MPGLEALGLDEGLASALPILYLEHEFTIPTECLPADNDETTFNLWVGVNQAPADTSGTTSELDDAAPAQSENTEATQQDGSEFNTLFYNQWTLKQQANNDTLEERNKNCFCHQR